MFPVTSYKDAEREAQRINSEVAQGKGFSGRMRGSAGFSHSVADAVLESIKHSEANEQTRAGYLNRFNAFARYLREKAPGVTAWADVTPAVIGNFVQYMRRQGLAHDTIRQRLQVLRFASRFMARSYDYRDVVSGVRLRRKDPPKAELDAAESILTPRQLRELLAWLEHEEPMFHVMACLQSLSGLRLMEAGYLRECDFDPEGKPVAIRASAAHAPKNRPSYRVLPVCETVASALAAWIDGLAVRYA